MVFIIQSYMVLKAIFGEIVAKSQNRKIKCDNQKSNKTR